MRANSQAHSKIAAMRAKLSIAKEMLEELLEERDEMEKRHADEVALRERQWNEAEAERQKMRAEIEVLKLQKAQIKANGPAAAAEQVCCGVQKVTQDGCTHPHI